MNKFRFEYKRLFPYDVICGCVTCVCVMFYAKSPPLTLTKFIGSSPGFS